MKILFIADLHDLIYENLYKIEKYDYDICILLGDIQKKYLDAIKQHVPIDKLYGVTGNHDTFNLLSQNGIEDLNLKNITINDINIAGISGGVKYKYGIYAMLTQEELLNKINLIDKCDILISHETGYHYLREDLPHEGFIAIDNFIKEKCPKYNVFGHYHNYSQFTRHNTTCICVYQCAILDYNTGKFTQIF